MIVLREVNETQASELAFIRPVYEQAFPADERRDFELLTDILTQQRGFHLLLIERDQAPVGFISYWSWDSIAYIEHFAIDQNCRGGGFGSKALQEAMAIIGKPVVLEVELPEDDFSKRRIGFYERLGYTLQSEYLYIQPPYSPEKRELPMYLMTVGIHDFTPELFDETKRLLYKEVYGRDV